MKLKFPWYKLTTVLCCVCLYSSIKVHSQVVIPGGDKKRIIVTDDTKPKDDWEEPEDPKDKAFVIKTSIFRPFRGEIPLLVEFPLHNKVSMELGVGYTFRDIYSISGTNNSSPFAEAGRFDPEYPMLNGVSQKGYGLTLSLKYFPDRIRLMGGYALGIHTNYRVHRYNFEAAGIRLAPATVTTGELAVMYYYQHNYSFFQELGAGLGMRLYTMDYIQRESTQTQWQTNYSYYAASGKFNTFTVFIQYKIGFDVFE